MNLRTFIERPVLSAVISITIVVVGIIGLFSLPVEQYPDIMAPVRKHCRRVLLRLWKRRSTEWKT